MDELMDFVLHLAFGGFLFLSLIYVVRVFFFVRSWPGQNGVCEVEGGVSWPARDALGLSKATDIEA